MLSAAALCWWLSTLWSSKSRSQIHYCLSAMSTLWHDSSVKPRLSKEGTTFIYLSLFNLPLWIEGSTVPVCNACISFNEFTSSHNLSSWDFTSSCCAAASPQRGERKKKNTQIRCTWVENTLNIGTVLDVHRYLQTEEVKRPSWCGMDG